MCVDYVTWRRIVETSEASRIVVYAEDEKTAVGVLAGVAGPGAPKFTLRIASS
jgi:hypothetical protein